MSRKERDIIRQVRGIIWLAGTYGYLRNRPLDQSVLTNAPGAGAGHGGITLIT